MFFDKFQALCTNKGVSCKKAVEDIGLSNSIATKWKKTGATPQGETLNKIATYFGVSIDYLLGNTQTGIARRISDCLAHQEVSEGELAKALGYNEHSIISKIEAGLVDLPTAKLTLIADFFHMPIEYILGSRETKWHPSIVEDYLKVRSLEEKRQIVDMSGGVDSSVAYDFYSSIAYAEKKPTAESSELDVKLEGIDFALYGEVKDLTEAQKRDVLRFVQFLKQEKKG